MPRNASEWELGPREKVCLSLPVLSHFRPLGHLLGPAEWWEFARFCKHPAPPSPSLWGFCSRTFGAAERLGMPRSASGCGWVLVWMCPDFLVWASFCAKSHQICQQQRKSAEILIFSVFAKYNPVCAFALWSAALCEISGLLRPLRFETGSWLVVGTHC